jgi:intraflagellar transport protein 88
MKGYPDFPTGFNLILCLYARADQNKMKDCFVSLLSIEISGETDEEEN